MRICSVCGKHVPIGQGKWTGQKLLHNPLQGCPKQNVGLSHTKSIGVASEGNVAQKNGIVQAVVIACS